jgi:dihydroneopterin aldolase
LGIFAGMGTIRRKVAIQEARFFAFHGYYPEEQIVGSEFMIDLEVEFLVSGSGGDDIGSTVNYEQLFSIAARQMREPKKLLETVAHAILEDVLRDYPSLLAIRVALAKLNPPLQGEVKKSLVQLTYNA